MSECVVRMKTPSSCYVCPLRIACVLYKKWLANEADMPCVYDDGCLIICQLPEGHGRLGDLDALCEGLVSNHSVVIYAKNATTIVPAERREKDGTD